MQDQNQAFISISQMLKATPRVEGGERCVYMEASNEAVDQQNETVLAQALEASADYYLRYGNLDIDHVTQIGAKTGIPGYELFEIGRPIEVKIDGPRTFVKGQIFSGEGPAAEKANNFWESLTNVNPPQRWYPSVGGQVMEKSQEFDPATGCKRALVTKVRWTNVGFSKTPVNQDVAEVSSVPFGALAKCWGPAGLDLSKALEAGYGSDAAALTGGGALRRQSLYGAPLNYWDFRDALAESLKQRDLARPNAARLVRFAADKWGIGRDAAAKWVERFMRDLKQGLQHRR